MTATDLGLINLLITDLSSCMARFWYPNTRATAHEPVLMKEWDVDNYPTTMTVINVFLRNYKFGFANDPDCLVYGLVLPAGLEGEARDKVLYRLDSFVHIVRSLLEWHSNFPKNGQPSDERDFYVAQMVLSAFDTFTAAYTGKYDRQITQGTTGDVIISLDVMVPDDKDGITYPTTILKLEIPYTELLEFMNQFGEDIVDTRQFLHRSKIPGQEGLLHLTDK